MFEARRRLERFVRAALGSWQRTCSPGILVGAWVGAAWATRMRSATQYRVLAVLLEQSRVF